MAKGLWIARTVCLGAALLLSLITLGLSAGYIGTLMQAYSGYRIAVPDFSALSLAVAIISMACLAPMLVIDFMRRGAFTSWIIVEVPITGFLSVMWLAAAADTASATAGLTVDCSGTLGDAATLCRSYQAIEAFTFLNWLILSGYHGVVFVMAIVGMVRGNKAIWRGTVRDTDFFARTANAYPSGPAAAAAPQLAYAQTMQAPYPQQQQQQQAQPYQQPYYAPSQYPPSPGSKIEV